MPENELYDNLAELLKNSGKYDKLNAACFTELLTIFDENPAEKPEIPEINTIINSLIYDYLREIRGQKKKH